MNTTEALQAYAPELVTSIKGKLNDFENLSNTLVGTLETCMTNVGEIIETLADAHAQALVKLAEREWRPIEEAPRDGLSIGEGTLVDLWSDSRGRLTNCFFDKTDNKWVQRIQYYSSSKRLTQFREVGDATHFRPIPSPPVQKEGV